MSDRRGIRSVVPLSFKERVLGWGVAARRARATPIPFQSAGLGPDAGVLPS